MKKTTISWLGIIFGTLIISIEFYMLQFLHMFALANGLDRIGVLKNSAIEYLNEPVICIALLLPVLVIITSAVLLYRDSK
mgnify:FL=1